jgi:hypothetical protein
VTVAKCVVHGDQSFTMDGYCTRCVATVHAARLGPALVEDFRWRLFCRRHLQNLAVETTPTTWFSALNQAVLHGVSPKEIAARFEVNPATVRRWVAGTSAPRPKLLQELIKWLSAEGYVA